MRIIALKALRTFWKHHPRAKAPLQAWYALAEAGDWDTPAKVMAQFGTSVDFVAGNRAIFDIAGNRNRLVAKINYPYRVMYIRFVGTHADYDRIDVETV